MKSVRLAVGAGLLIMLVGWKLTAGHFASPDDSSRAVALTQADVVGIQKEALKEIDKALRKPGAQVSPKRIRTAAFAVALVADKATGQPGMDADFLNELRNAALHLAEAAPTRIRVNEARGYAEQIKIYPKYHSGVRTGPVDLLKQFEMRDIMRVFEKPDKGGQGVEPQMLKLENVRRTYKPGQLEDWRLSALKTILIADLVRNYTPDGGPEKQKQWRQFSDEMSQTAKATLGAAKAKDSKAFRTALLKLNDSCTNCHQVFKKGTTAQGPKSE